MRTARRIARPTGIAATVVILIAGLAGPALATTAPTPASSFVARAHLTGRGHHVHLGRGGEVDVNVCSDAIAPGLAHCDAHVHADLAGRTPDAASERGANAGDVIGDGGAYSPAYLQSAYNASSSTNGGGQTVAIVDAFDAPNAESDLAVYRAEWGLPACTTANGCFAKVDQRGGTAYPMGNSGWEGEISLDIDMVSAMCPNCHILLVEADDSSFLDLGAAVNEAVALGANVVSNSYGGSEWSNETQFDVAFMNHPGVAIVASTGDDGYGVSYPAASPGVVAVGGTSLFQATARGSRDATESVWSGAGSGCSAFEPKPPWQADTGCANRTVGDVAAVADPATGVWVYDGGWTVFGGTSVASPIIGALYALAGNAASSDTLASYPYAHTTSFNDVVSGSNGDCGGTYLCTGSVGYDGPTGLGTPDAVDAFTPAVTPPPAPDFSLTATSPPAMRTGGTVKSTVTVTSQNAFVGNVKLTATASPATGLSKSFSPATVTVGASPGKSTLTITGNVPRTYTVTITATQGTLVHSRVITVNVNDFRIKVTPAKVTVTRSQAAHYTVTLTPLGTFKGIVTLSVSGLRPHDTVTYAHNPTLANGPQTVTITTSHADAAGTLTLHFKGTTNAALSHSAVATLVLQ